MPRSRSHPGPGELEEHVHAPLLRARALPAGISDHDLHGPHWTRALRGVYRWGGPRTAVADRIAEVAAVLPEGAAIGGWASLWRHGATDLDGVGLSVSRVSRVPRSRASVPSRRAVPSGPAPILVCIGPSARIRPRPQIDVSRRQLPDEDVVDIGGVAFVRPARSAVDLIARQPPDLGLASLDAAIRAGVMTAAAVERYLLAHPRLYGRPRVFSVLRLADGRARSRQESVFRWIWVVEAGLPRPLVNPGICDATGTLLGEPDLLDAEAGLVGEFDGSHHRGLQQHTSDNIREELFEGLNLEVVRATSLDLWTRRPELVRRLRDKYRRAISRDRSRDSWFLRRAS